VLDAVVLEAVTGPASGIAQAAVAEPQRVVRSDFQPGREPGSGEVHLYYARSMASGGPLLRVRMSNQVFQRILADARLQGRRAAAIIDGQHVLVARLPRPEALVGKTATPPVRQGLGQADEGILYNIVNQDGLASVVAFARAPRSGFAVVTAVPEEEFYTTLRAAMTRTYALGAAVLALAFVACWRGVRRLERALEQVALASSGTAPPTGLRETDELAQRLATAARGQSAAMQAKDRFLAVLSHELRTPLSAILGWVRVLGLDADAATRARGLQAIDRNARAQARLVDDLLDLSRIAAGKLDLTRAPVAVGEIALNVVESAQPGADAASVTLALEQPPTPCVVLGDEARLQQLLWNLVNNAIRFSAAGSRVVLRVARRDGWVDISVIDDGAGIAPDLLPHLFEPFRQGDQSLSRKHGGLGLGLAIARDIVAQHGGRIEAHSAGPGQGAQFVVQLPAAPDEAGAPSSSTRLDGQRIVVVDDDADNLHLIAMVLERAGARVRTANGAQAALDLIRTQPVDLLVTDIAMPQTDGLALMQLVRALGPAASGLRAVAVTALTSAEDVRRTLEAGFDVHLPKPLQPEALLRACARLASQTLAARPTALPL
jgi:signal transduction histidine kinase/ActR/RegA family two-component response regulator